MNQSLFKRYILLLSTANGVHRTLYQVPFHIGLSLNLIRLDLPIAEALSLLFIFVAAIPYCFAFILEIAGGWVSNKLGVLGSFKLLPLGFFLRLFAQFFMVCSCFMPTVNLAILFGFLGVAFGYLAYSIISGIYEDAYGQTAAYLSPEDKGSKIIAGMDFRVFYIHHISRLIVSPLCTAAVVIGFYFYDTPFMQLFILAPFVFAGCLSLTATKVAHNWYRQAKIYIKEGNQKTTNSWQEQTALFFRKGDWLWGVATGFHLMIVFWVISLAPLTTEGILESYAIGEKSWASLINIVVMTFVIAAFYILGQMLFDRFVGKDKDKRLTILHKMDSPMGYLYLVAICLTAIPLTLLHLPLYIQYTLLCVMVIANAPILLWTNWMRIPLCDEAANKHPSLFHANKSFYFSLISGVMQSCVCFCALLEYVGKLFYGEASQAAFVIMANILLVISLGLWLNRRKAFHQQELKLSS